MSSLFVRVLNMSFIGSYVIVIVILIRFMLRRIPKTIIFPLWGVVAFRLLIPFSFKGMFSLVYPFRYSLSDFFETGTSQSILHEIASQESLSNNKFLLNIGSYIWISVSLMIVLYSFITVYLLKRKLVDAQFIRNNIYEARNLKTPFVLGLVKPKIFMPAGLSSEERELVLIHEETHIRRKDHFIKTIAFLVLAMHWFNPLVWIAFVKMTTDMELSCDEGVLKDASIDVKKSYANALLFFAGKEHPINGTSTAFNEGNLGARINHVLTYKKPNISKVFLSVIFIIVVSIGLSSDPLVIIKETALNPIMSIEVDSEDSDERIRVELEHKNQVRIQLLYIEKLRKTSNSLSP